LIYKIMEIKKIEEYFNSLLEAFDNFTKEGIKK